MKKNTNSGLFLSELMDIGEQDDEEICFRWDEYLHTLHESIKEMAVDSCHDALRKIKKLADGFESDYQPPSQASSASEFA